MKQEVKTPKKKPCCCGSTNLKLLDMANDFHHCEWQVVCKRCGRFEPMRGAKSKHRAICKWNNLI